MWDVLLRLYVILSWVCAAFILFTGLILMAALIGWSTQFHDRTTLPNGMILKRQFDFTRYGRDDLFATDDRGLLARDIEYVCFNDRFVEVYSLERGQGGLFDSQSGAKVPAELRDMAHADSGLGGNRKACNGYYLGLLDPEFLYDDTASPFLAPCDWRNFANKSLSNRAWFARPCDTRD